MFVGGIIALVVGMVWFSICVGVAGCLFGCEVVLGFGMV